MKKLGEDPGDRPRSDAALRPLRPLRPARRGGRTARSPSAPASRKGSSPDDIDLERALGLLSLPREVGKHPEDGEPILAGIGRFGPYVQHGKTYANLETGDDVLTIGLNRAVTLIAEKKPKSRQGRRFGADPGRPLGDHPDKGGPVVVKKRPLRPLCQPRRRQRHAAVRHDAGDGHAGAGAAAARRARRARRRRARKREPAKAAPSTAAQGSTGEAEAPPRRRQGRSRQGAKRRSESLPSAKAAKTKAKPPSQGDTQSLPSRNAESLAGDFAVECLLIWLIPNADAMRVRGSFHS